MSTEKIKGVETKGEGFIVSWTNLKKCGYIKCNGRKFLINDKNFGYDEVEKIELLEALKGENRYLKVEFIIVAITKRNTFLKKIRLKKIKSKDDLYFEEVFLRGKLPTFILESLNQNVKQTKDNFHLQQERLLNALSLKSVRLLGGFLVKEENLVVRKRF